jgi:putative hydrolase of the HAD superfamily
VTLVGLRAITFDCWGTLIFDRPAGEDGRSSLEVRVEALARHADIPLDRARELLTTAWRHHHDAWVDLRSYGAPGVATFCLHELGIDDPNRHAALVEEFEKASAAFGVETVPGAVEVLDEIRARDMRTALVCDTGFTPGRIVRSLLADKGLLERLDVLAFSDEVGVPKPHERMFRTALDGIGVEASAAAHVGDLRRTDVAGARGAGMQSVRFAGVYDDTSDHPEADLVITKMSELAGLLDGDGSAL